MTDPFYLSGRWRALRKLVIQRAKYTDQLRLREGVHIEADTVHHIFPREAYPEYEWCRWNLIAINHATHKILHTPTGTLSKAGQALQEETAAEQGIKINKTILICGEPGSGKSTAAKKELRGGIAYDLDYIAGAFRLRGPHEERHPAARRMANALAAAFVEKAKEYSGRVLIIRTAPTIDEIALIDPDEIIICGFQGAAGRKDDAIDAEDLQAIRERIAEIREFAISNKIELKEDPPRVEPSEKGGAYWAGV